MSAVRPELLPRACRRAFSLILNLLAGGDFGDPEGLRKRIAEMFSSFERDAQDAGIRTEDIFSARFALTAFLDEAINRSDWQGKAVWANRPLSLEQFNTNRAGDEFFDRLDTIRQHPEASPDLLEIYYTCLTLGFEGKYALAEPGKFQQLIEATARDLERVRGRPGLLSPHALPPEQAFEQLKNDVPLWVVAGALAGIVFVIFIVLRVMATTQAQDAADDLIRLLQ